MRDFIIKGLFSSDFVRNQSSVTIEWPGTISCYRSIEEEIIMLYENIYSSIVTLQIQCSAHDGNNIHPFNRLRSERPPVTTSSSQEILHQIFGV